MAAIDDSRRTRAHVDGILLALVFGMAVFGVVAVCVATFSPDSDQNASFLNHVVNSSYALKQCLFLMLAPLVVGVITVFPHDLLRRRSELFYWIAFVLLTFTTIFNRAQGVKAWLDVIWGYTIQPAEFMKLSLILVLAKNLARQAQPLSDARSFFRVFALVGIPGMVILMEGETGSLLVIIFMFAVMLYFANVSMKTLGILAGLAVLGILALAGLLMLTSSGEDNYRLARILSWINPEEYSTDAYQQSMSKMTIGSGGLIGNGMFVTGAISQLNYVPADWTDFIYATIGETWGFAGCMAVLVVYILILLRMLYLAWYTRDKFGRLIIIGVMGMLLFHILENIAMTLGLMPITGIPLPFLSYGGSNMMTNMGGVGLVLNVTRNRSIAVPVNTPQTLHNRYGFSRVFKTKAY